jgi:hypothetical protein
MSVSQLAWGKERKFIWGRAYNFGQSCFCMSRGKTRKRRELELEKPWRVNYGAFF